MTFGVLPGMCLVAYCYECGYEARPIKLSGLWKWIRGTYRAKYDAISETGRLLAGNKFGVFVAIVISLVLMLLHKDTVLLGAINATAVPAGSLSYRLGRRTRISLGKTVEEARRPLDLANLSSFLGPIMKSGSFVLLFWSSMTGIVLVVAYIGGIWKPI